MKYVYLYHKLSLEILMIYLITCLIACLIACQPQSVVNASYESSENKKQDYELDQASMMIKQDQQISSQLDQSLAQALDQAPSQALDQAPSQALDQDFSQTLDQDFSQTLDQNLSQTLDQNLSQTLDQDLSQALDQDLSQALDQDLNLWPPQDANRCLCESNQIYLDHECAPTLSLGCTHPCEEMIPCPVNQVCEDCVAFTHALSESGQCDPIECKSACIVEYAPHVSPQEPLRLSPTQGEPFRESLIQIQGSSFYIGALGHRVKINDQILDWSNAIPISRCTLEVTLPAMDEGIHSIWVSQYSGEAPWVLAGFYRVGLDTLCIQPGDTCDVQSSAGLICCQTNETSMECSTGRCMPVRE